MDDLAVRIIRIAREHRPARSPAYLRPVRGRARDPGRRHPALFVTWLDELPGARR